MKIVLQDVYMDDIQELIRSLRGEQAAVHVEHPVELVSPVPDRVLSMPNKLDAVKFCKDTLIGCGMDCSLIQVKRFVECIYDIANTPRSPS